MVVGFVGSGSMAAAMARGWAGALERMLFTDSGSGRARALAQEVGGEASPSNAELAAQADVVVLAMKPDRLGEVAAELGATSSVVSLLAATPLEQLLAAFPRAEILRVIPNVGVEVRRGVLCVAGEGSAELRGRLEVLGRVVELADSELDAATAVMSCSPAYLALAVGALVEAGVEAGLEERVARELVVETVDGTVELLRVRSPAELREAVASPGGSTEAGLGVLERDGVPGAFGGAVRASLERMRG